MKPIRTLFALLCLAACLQAAEDEVQLKFTRLDLTDGRMLKNVVVKSYDASADKFLLLADGKVTLIPAALVPQPVCDNLKAGAPKSGSTTSSTPKPPVPMGDGTMPKKSDQSGQASAPHTTTDNTDAKEATQLERHKQAALARAQTYYGYEYQTGSNAIKITSMNFETDPAEPIPGWPGRYRTTGRAFLQFFDSKGWSYSRATDKFEIVTEQKHREPIKVLDFSRK